MSRLAPSPSSRSPSARIVTPAERATLSREGAERAGRGHCVTLAGGPQAATHGRERVGRRRGERSSRLLDDDGSAEAGDKRKRSARARGQWRAPPSAASGGPTAPVEAEPRKTPPPGVAGGWKRPGVWDGTQPLRRDFRSPALVAGPERFFVSLCDAVCCAGVGLPVRAWRAAQDPEGGCLGPERWLRSSGFVSRRDAPWWRVECCEFRNFPAAATHCERHRQILVRGQVVAAY